MFRSRFRLARSRIKLAQWAECAVHTVVGRIQIPGKSLESATGYVRLIVVKDCKNILR
jgi:hypothetical protein